VLHSDYAGALCGFSRSMLLGATYALSCNADYFVYVEQDCVLKGSDLLQAAVGAGEKQIYFGAPVVNGQGLNGAVVTSDLIQVSLVVVRRDALLRFIHAMTFAPNDLPAEQRREFYSPEFRWMQLLKTFASLQIPFGRSRPLNFGLPHYYAQHLSDLDLLEFMVGEGLNPRRYFSPQQLEASLQAA
jgi:hypothetical protein